MYSGPPGMRFLLQGLYVPREPNFSDSFLESACGVRRGSGELDEVGVEAAFSQSLSAIFDQWLEFWRR